MRDMHACVWVYIYYHIMYTITAIMHKQSWQTADRSMIIKF